MHKQTIAEIKRIFESDKVEQDVLNKLRMDQRKGVQKLLNRYDAKQQKLFRLQQLYDQKREFEKHFLQEGESYLAGVDEAGRGPLAGPVVAASVVLPDDFKLYGLTDSKQLTREERDIYFDEIRDQALTYHVAVIHEKQIDRVNIYEATKLAMLEALDNLNPLPHVGLIDAVKLSNTKMRTEAIIKGDGKSIAIAAASVLAKVTRDKLMEEMHEMYPMYGFSQHKGYGTKEHLAALQQYGPCEFHRKSFTPVLEAMRQ